MPALDPVPMLRSRGSAVPRAPRVPIWTADTLEILYGHADLEEVERFRYSIYVAEQHKPLPAADHLARRLPDEDDADALHFCLRNGERQLVGYARMHYADGIPSATVSRLALSDLLERSPKSLGFISKLMVDKSLRGRTNAVRLIMSMIQYGCERFQDAEGAVFHCSSELVPLYTRMGFRPFGVPFIDPHVGKQTPMVAIFRDLAHFEECGSPIASVVQALVPHGPQAARFRDYFVIQRAFRTESHPHPHPHPHPLAHAHRPSGFRSSRSMPLERGELKSGLNPA
ncbi:MAG: cyclic nucleotide-binding protein [Ramlibacter sp.]|jgi:predicted GNAT family N-acyltransferase|nr:cyclic nucleotide-binding protein [Ramlibacter sp.]